MEIENAKSENERSLVISQVVKRNGHHKTHFKRTFKSSLNEVGKPLKMECKSALWKWKKNIFSNGYSALEWIPGLLSGKEIFTKAWRYLTQFVKDRGVLCKRFPQCKENLKLYNRQDKRKYCLRHYIALQKITRYRITLILKWFCLCDSKCNTQSVKITKCSFLSTFVCLYYCKSILTLTSLLSQWTSTWHMW